MKFAIARHIPPRWTYLQIQRTPPGEFLIWEEYSHCRKGLPDRAKTPIQNNRVRREPLLYLDRLHQRQTLLLQEHLWRPLLLQF